jgi:hypothetical protein
MMKLKSQTAAKKVARRESVKKQVGRGARRLFRDGKLRKEIIDDHEEAWKRLAKR